MTGLILIPGRKGFSRPAEHCHLPICIGQPSLVQFLMTLTIMATLCSMVAASLKAPVAQARESALAGTLRNLRTQLMTYKLQHCDNPPDGLLLPELLTGTSDARGNIGVGPQYPAGPYFTSLPVNPYNGRTDIKVVQPGAPLTPDGTTGWLYQANGSNVRIVANCTQSDTAGRPLVSY